MLKGSFCDKGATCDVVVPAAPERRVFGDAVQLASELPGKLRVRSACVSSPAPAALKLRLAQG